MFNLPVSSIYEDVCDRPFSLTEDFMDEHERTDIDVDTIPDSDTREDDLAAIIDYKSFNNRRINYGEYIDDTEPDDVAAIIDYKRPKEFEEEVKNDPEYIKAKDCIIANFDM